MGILYLSVSKASQSIDPTLKKPIITLLFSVSHPTANYELPSVSLFSIHRRVELLKFETRSSSESIELQTLKFRSAKLLCCLANFAELPTVTICNNRTINFLRDGEIKMSSVLKLCV